MALVHGGIRSVTGETGLASTREALRSTMSDHHEQERSRDFLHAGSSARHGTCTAVCTVSRGARVGLWRAKPNSWGTLRLTTTGGRSVTHSSVVFGYFQDGPSLVTLVMNGWADGEPGWWLILQDQTHGRRRARRPPVHGHGPRRRGRGALWPAGQVAGDRHNRDAFAALQSSETAVVVPGARTTRTDDPVAGSGAPEARDREVRG